MKTKKTPVSPELFPMEGKNGQYPTSVRTHMTHYLLVASLLVMHFKHCADYQIAV